MATRKAALGKPEVLGPEPSNGAAPDIELDHPYVVEFALEGVCPILFHRWNNEAVAEKASAKKGSAAKKSDNVESYVARNEKGEICLPGVYVYGAMCDKKNGAAKYRQDQVVGQFLCKGRTSGFFSTDRVEIAASVRRTPL